LSFKVLVIGFLNLRFIWNLVPGICIFRQKTPEPFSFDPGRAGFFDVTICRDQSHLSYAVNKKIEVYLKDLLAARI